MRYLQFIPGCMSFGLRNSEKLQKEAAEKFRNMMAAILEYRATVVVSLLLLMYFLWMDITLYYQIQSMHPMGSVTSKPSMESHALFSPFSGLSVKMMMMDQVNNYIHTPLAQIFNQVSHFSDVFYFITPNMISFLGVLFALAAAKCVSADNLTMHYIAVLLFQIRTWLDALDGIVARARLGVIQHVSLRYTTGYVVDGLADAIGFGAFVYGCYIYLCKIFNKSKYYLPVHNEDGGIEKNGMTPVYSTPIVNPGKALFVCCCFGFQLALSAFCWDHYVDAYHSLLENRQVSESEAIIQNEILRSSVVWVIMWFWRILNAHSLMQMLLFAVFINRIWEFLTWIQYIGFSTIIILTVLTHLHLHSIQNYIGHVS